jgi:hypothetical protein
MGENIQVYAERILGLAGEAYTGVAREDIERSLIDSFVDRLNNDQLKMKIFNFNCYQ